MRKLSKKLIIVGAIVSGLATAMGAPALAQSSNNLNLYGNNGKKYDSFKVGVGLSSLGFNLKGQYRASKNWGGQILGNYEIGGSNLFPIISVINENLYTKTTVGTVGILADYYFTDDFTLSAGIAYNFSKYVSNHTVTNDDSDDIGVSITETPNKIAPVVKVGYDHSFGSNFGLGVDLGAYYVGKVKTSFDVLDSSTTVGLNGLAEVETLRQNATNDSKSIYPYISVQMTYKF